MYSDLYSPDGGHALAFQHKPLLAFDETADFAAQRAAIRDRVLACLGDMPDPVPLCPVILEETEHATFTERKIAFDVEAGVKALAILCIPKLGKAKYPLCICLQGHSKGMHRSLNRSLHPDELDASDGDRDIALQALAHGFAALCVEQRAMGERRTPMSGEPDDGRPTCYMPAMNALLLGRTLLGERCWDVSRAIDLALTYDFIDGERILCTGNSGGGTVTYYAAIYDERIGAAMPCCSVCAFGDSIGAMRHCSCNYLPGIAKYVDMGDMAAAIAPRYLIVLNGDEDPIFPKHGVDKVWTTIEKVYAAAGVPDNCAHREGHGGHRYYKAEAWDALDTIVQW